MEFQCTKNMLRVQESDEAIWHAWCKHVDSSKLTSPTVSEQTMQLTVRQPEKSKPTEFRGCRLTFLRSLNDMLYPKTLHGLLTEMRVATSRDVDPTILTQTLKDGLHELIETTVSKFEQWPGCGYLHHFLPFPVHVDGEKQCTLS